MISSFSLFLGRELSLGAKNIAQILTLPCFFVLMTALFPLSLGPETEMLSRFGPGLIMISALLASLLPLERLYSEDLKDGTIDSIVLSYHPLAVYVLCKIAVHWIMTGLPMTLVSIVLTRSLGSDIPIGVLLPALGCSTLLFTLIGQMVAVLGLQSHGRNNSIFFALLIIPFYIPILIFGAGALDLAAQSLPTGTPLLLLWAALALCLPLIPLITAQLLKVKARS